MAQDTSRKFLTGSSPEAKYDFFYRGTMLADLHDLIVETQEQITEFATILQDKQKTLKKMRARVKELEEKRDAVWCGLLWVAGCVGSLV